MLFISLASVVVAVLLVLTHPTATPAAVPFLLLWLLSPVTVSWLGVAWKAQPAHVLASADRLGLRWMARETWRYFDDLVGPASNWLPPDNYQEAPRPELAERTSPTNVGLWLLATLAAHDFGYLTPDQVIERGEATLDTLERVERFEGHLLNWYNTRTLEPLLPRYISTVDSGNLLASLWTAVQGYGELLVRPHLGPEALLGLDDTITSAFAHGWSVADLPPGVDARRAASLLSTLSRVVLNPPPDPAGIVARLQAALGPAQEFAATLRDRSGTTPDVQAPPGEATAAYWAAKIECQITEWLEVAKRYYAAVPVVPAAAADFTARVERLIARIEALAAAMNLRFLYDTKRHLFTIGYNVSDQRLDTSHYDLLASEARLASLVAIARGDVPAAHWFALGRTFGETQGHRVLFSWSGTMFEYLMPLLFTRTYPHTLLDEALREAVGLQIDYGRQQRVPWGISEAAFAATDSHQIYQYQAFGVPGLGLKRGLADDLVVAPYATVLAAMVDPEAALANLHALDRLGLRGDYGFYESIDFTRRRQPKGVHGVVVHTHMVHHLGMTLLALDNVLGNGRMQARFHADPRVQAVEPLLFERAPVAPLLVEATERGEPPLRRSLGAPVETAVPLDAPTPSTQLLGNGTYTVMVTSSGGGYSRWRDLDVTRWRADTTLDAAGSFYYVHDVDRKLIWSATYQPVGRPASRYMTRFNADRAEFERRDFGIGVTTEIGVSPDDAVEIRYLTITNYSNRQRRLEVTSYVELALASHGADLAHPAFSKLFVQTEALLASNVLLAWRKPRSPQDQHFYAFHVLAMPASPGTTVRARGYDTDRARFLGRDRSPANPLALEGDLSGSAGSVLDPIFSLRCALTLEPGEQAELAFVTGAADSREAAIALAEQYAVLHTAHRALDAATTQGQAIARQLGAASDDLQRFQQLASPLLYPSANLRASERQLRRNRLGQAGLWAHGISGDLPILLVTLGDRRDMEVVREALLAHAYWRLLGFRADLVILNEEASGYDQPLQTDLRRAIQRYAPSTPLDEPGGIFARPAGKLPEDDIALLFAVARVILVASRGPLIQQLAIPTEVTPLPLALPVARPVEEEPSAPLPFMELPYFNGVGGFTADGREYAIYLGAGTQTPAPWINVLANPTFGALVSESGAGFAWSANSQANKLTPWSNDPVTDAPGDAIYIRDAQLGVFWSPAAAPIRELDAYRARHGQGYTVFEHNSHALEQELVTFVPLDDAGGAPVRVQRLRLRNRASRRRRLSVFSYLDWVLGTSREETQMHVVTSWDAESRTLLARNSYHPDFASRVAFASASPAPQTYTADRTEFLGRNGSYTSPAALQRLSLSGQVGAGFDPCAALQVVVELDPGQECEITFLMGEAADAIEVQRLVERFRDPGGDARPLR
jgi:cyclic beta-1,2-glucan synthetase